MDCTKCTSKGCRKLDPCVDHSAAYLEEYATEANREYTKTASLLIDNGRAGTLNRLEEIVEYANLRGYSKLGVAYCYGMEADAQLLRRELEQAGFKTTMVSCTIDGISETSLDPQKTKEVVSCNPLGQAYALNQAEVDFVILMGLCLGHDIILQKNLQTDFTTFIVKDRVLQHNPRLALYHGKTAADNFLAELPKDFKLLKLDEFRQKLQRPNFTQEAYLIDLRSAEAHAENGIPGSIQCLIRDLPDQYTSLLPDKNKEVIIYCNGGMQSLYAVMYLTMQGYKNVKSLAGGYSKYLS